MEVGCPFLVDLSCHYLLNTWNQEMTWRIFGQWKHREAEDRTAATASVGLLELRIKYPCREPEPNILYWAVSMPAFCSGGRQHLCLPRPFTNKHLLTKRVSALCEVQKYKRSMESCLPRACGENYYYC